MNNTDLEYSQKCYDLGIEFQKNADKKCLWFLRGILLFFIYLILFHPPFIIFNSVFTKIIIIIGLLLSSIAQLLDYISDRIFSHKLENISNNDTIRSIKILNISKEIFVYILYVFINFILIFITLIKF